MEIEVANYIREAKARGISDSEIKQNLFDAGWEASEVDNAFAHVRASEFQPLVNKDEDFNLPQTIPAAIITPAVSPAATVHAGLEISEQHFQRQNGNSFFKKPLLWILVALIIILAGGGYWFYAYGGFYPPSTIWKKFTQNTASKIFQNNFTVSYKDTTSTSSQQTISGLNLKDIVLSFNGKSYYDATDAKNPLSSSEITYTFGSGNSNFTTGLKVELINNVLYINIGENPFLNSLFSSMAKNQKIDWIKIDINSLKNNLGTGQESADINRLQEILNSDFQKEISKIWEDSTSIKMEKYLGREKVGDISTLHFKNSVDKQAIKNAFNATLDKVASAMNSKTSNDAEKIQDKDTLTAKAVVSAIVDKMEISNLETWIGVRDFRLYKIKLASNAPSVISLIKNASSSGILNGSQSKSRDAVRLADIRQIASALELYFNDNNGYPASLNGQPVGLNPTYIGINPTAPLPADGTCTDYYNTFWYEAKGKKTGTPEKPVYDSYELTFCLGNATGGYPAGLGKLTPSGIETGLTCPGTQEQCISNKPAQPEKTGEELANDFISNWDFGAQFNLESTYSDYGKKQNLQAPENSIDLLELIKNQAPKLP